MGCEGPREFMLALSLPASGFDDFRYWRSAAWCSPHTDLCSVLLSGAPRCQAWPRRILQPGGSTGAAWHAKLRYRPCVVQEPSPPASSCLVSQCFIITRVVFVVVLAGV